MRLKRIVSVLLAALLLAMVPLNALAADNPVPKAKQAVVCIVSGIGYQNGKPYTYDGYYGIGTGFGVGRSGEDAQIFVTNNHVISDKQNKPYDQVYIFVDNANLYDESSVVPCRILYADPQVDLAIIQAEAPIPGVGTLPLRSAKEIKTGDDVYALGFPAIADELADSNHYTVDDITVTDGIVSRRLQIGGVDYMAHTAKINHGNSGGPLINAYGQVIGINGNVVGINTLGIADVENADLRCYAFDIDYAIDVLEQLELPYTKAAGNVGGLSLAAAAAIGVGIAVVLVLAVVLLLRKKQSGKVPKVLIQAICGPLQGQSWELLTSLSIGRNPGENIVLPPDTSGISRRHCLIARRGNQVTVTDLGSSYGTFLNGSRITANQPVAVPNGAVLSLASNAVQFRLLIT